MLMLCGSEEGVLLVLLASVLYVVCQTLFRVSWQHGEGETGKIEIHYTHPYPQSHVTACRNKIINGTKSSSHK